MRKWQNLAAPDDPGSWFDVFHVWPTPYGTYETCAPYIGLGSSTAGTQSYAFAAKTLSGAREYVVTATKLIEFSAGPTYTDRTNAMVVGSYPMMAQFGNATICVMGAANPTIVSTGGNFTAVSGAPNGEIVIVVEGVALIFNSNTSTDGWHASDVFDYTNWTTGEAASGRLLDTPGPITAACAFGGCAYVFKANSIYRGRYVGGAIKWEWHLVWNGTGIQAGSGFTANLAKHYVGVGLDCMMFCSNRDKESWASSNKASSSFFYLYDGVSAPRIVNPLTTIYEGAILHDPAVDMFTVMPLEVTGAKDRAYFYSKPADAWGYYGTPLGTSASTNPPRPVMGEYAARVVVAGDVLSPLPAFYSDSGGSTGRVTSTAGSATTSMLLTPYLETAKVGRPDVKTLALCATPELRRMQGGNNGVSDVPMACTVKAFRERHDTSASATPTATQNADRVRFDFIGADNFFRIKITFPNRNFEIDDISLTAQGSSKN